MKSYSNSKPAVLEECRGGRYLYHWDITEQTVDDEEGQRVEYAYEEVAVYAPLSADKILRLVINELWDKDAEQKLINEYNAYMLGVGNESARDAYVTFLQERARVKAQVEAHCKEYNIR